MPPESQDHRILGTARNQIFRSSPGNSDGQPGWRMTDWNTVIAFYSLRFGKASVSRQRLLGRESGPTAPTFVGGTAYITARTSQLQQRRTYPLFCLFYRRCSYIIIGNFKDLTEHGNDRLELELCSLQWLNPLTVSEALLFWSVSYNNENLGRGCCCLHGTLE